MKTDEKLQVIRKTGTLGRGENFLASVKVDVTRVRTLISASRSLGLSSM